MTLRRKTGLRDRLLAIIAAYFGPGSAPADDYERARQLIAAVDRGGIPLNAARVNQIARDLGLEVSRQAAVPETLERIRAALARRS